MPRLTQAPNFAIATLWAEALSNLGIATSVQRQYLSSVAGELPPRSVPAGGVVHPSGARGTGA